MYPMSNGIMTPKRSIPMSIVLKLPAELKRQLAAEAARLRLPLSEYALRVLALGQLPTPAPRTGAELVAYWKSEGLVGTRQDIKNGPAHARALRRGAEKRKRS
jgi:hypothetical protein